MAGTVSFVGAANGVDASLMTGSATGQGADTIAGVEWLVGSAKSDRLEGNNGANYLEGRAGPDALFGNGGSDFLAAGRGTDSANGGAGTDSCIGAETTTSCEQSFDTGFDLNVLWHPDAGNSRVAALFPVLTAR